MITQRILAVLAAMLLVGAVALAMLGPPEVPLGQLLFMVDHDLMNARAQRFIGTHLAAWLWDYLIAAADAAPGLAGAGRAGADLRRAVAVAVHAEADAPVASAELNGNRSCHCERSDAIARCPTPWGRIVFPSISRLLEALRFADLPE